MNITTDEMSAAKAKASKLRLPGKKKAKGEKDKEKATPTPSATGTPQVPPKQPQLVKQHEKYQSVPAGLEKGILP